MAKKPEVVERDMMMIGNVLAVSVEPGTKIFDVGENLLRIVEDRKPVIDGQTAYFSTNDYQAVKRVLSAPSKVLPGLPGSRSVH